MIRATRKRIGEADFPNNRGVFGALKQVAGQANRRSGLRAPDDALIWWMSTENVGPAHCRRWLGILDAEERERAGSFRFDHDRTDFIAAHALLRRMLASHLLRPAPQWRFCVGEFGKPRIAEQFRLPDVDVSLAHTRGLVAAALVTHGTIGVDVEKIDPAKADFAVAHNYFAPAEIEILGTTVASERATCFFRLWTLKEAYLKAIGTGLGTPLFSFAFTLEPIGIDFLRGAGDDPKRWQFETLPTTGGHVLSVAVAGENGERFRIAARAVDPQDL
jgi:4'-phosphopantetheinyl transferase